MSTMGALKKMAKADEKAERILTAAFDVFTRFGFKRTTMGDIAEAAQVSRPALYLAFSDKEEIFSAIVARRLREMIDQVGKGLDQFDTVRGKLAFVFEIWCVVPFEIVQASPNAKDLHEASHVCAADIVTTALAEYETILAKILTPLVRAQPSAGLSSRRISRVLIGALHGFKDDAKDTTQLRQLIADLIDITCASLDDTFAPAGDAKNRIRRS